MATVIETQETALVEEIREITAANHTITIVCDGDYAMAGDLLRELKEKEKLAREWFAPMLRDAHQAHKTIKTRENEVIKPLVEARKTVGAVMGRYQYKLEEERKQELEVARVAEQKIANEGAEKYAAGLEAQGLSDLADAARKNVPAVQPILESTAPKVSGTSVRTTWKYEIVDEDAIPLKYMCVDEKHIAATVRARKDSTSIPGIRVWAETNVS